MKKILSFLLALVMVLSMLPTTFPAMEVSAEGAAATEVTLTVTPSATHAVKAEGETNYTLTAALSLSTNTAFALGSLQFEATPAEGLSLELADPTATDAIPVEMGAGEEEKAGMQIFAWNYVPAVEDDPLTEDVNEAVVGVPAIDLTANTEYALGTITMTSASPFSISDAKLVGTEACEYASAEENGTKYDLAVALAGEYAKGGHGDATTAWTPITSAADLANMANGGYYYLAGDIKSSGQVKLTTAVSATLCLNGKTLTEGSSGTASTDNLWAMSGGAQLTVCDCTAHVDENDEYVAGTIIPGSAGGGVVRMEFDSTAQTADTVFTMYDGIINGATTNKNGNFGGAFRVKVTNYAKDGKSGKINLLGGQYRNIDCRQGGLVYMDSSSGAELTMDKVVCENIIACQNHGGVIYSGAKNTISITNSKFFNNGAVVTDETDDGNKSTAKNGGVIWAAGTVTIDNCEFKENTGSNGAVIFFQGATNATVKDSKFTNNTSVGEGCSAIHIESSSEVTLDGCTITDNARTKESTASGAVRLHAESSTLTLKGKTVIDNNTEADETECNIYLSYDYNPSNAANTTVKVDGVTAGSKFSVRTKDDRNDANKVLVAGANQPVWDSNWATYEQRETDSIVRDGSGFKFVTHYHEEFPTAPWQKWGDDADELTSLPTESGYYYLTSDVTLAAQASYTADANVVICLNHKTITANGERIFYIKGQVDVTVCDCTATGSITDGTYDAGKMIPGVGSAKAACGGGVAALIADGTKTKSFTMTDGIVDGEGVTSEFSGAAFFNANQYSTLNLYGGVVQNCTAGNTGADTATNIGGGAVYNSSSAKLNAKNMLFKNNKATGDNSRGGALLINSGSNAVSIEDCIFEGNTAKLSGGAIHMESGTATITGGEIKGSSAEGATGGGLCIRGGTVTLDSVDVKNNALAAANMHLYGGGLYATGCTLTIRNNCVFDGNSATASGTYPDPNDSTKTKIYESHGGAMYLCALTNESAPAVTVLNSTFTNNSAYKGGVFEASGTSSSKQVKPTFTGCTFTGNTADGFGGVALLYQSQATFTDNCTFTENKSTSNSAAVLYESDSSTTTFDDCTIEGNTFTTDGCAVWVQASSSKLIVKGKTVINNNVNSSGVERNVYFAADYATNNNNLLRVKDLESGAHISVLTKDDRSADVTKVILPYENYAPENWESGWVTYENNGQSIDYVNGAFVFVDNTTHSHTDDTQTGASWTALTSTLSFPNSGNYYLTKDITAAATVTVNGTKNVVLCLNGHNISGTVVIFKLDGNASLTICDCTAHTTDGQYYAGAIRGGIANGGCVYLNPQGKTEDNLVTFTLKSGILEGTGKNYTTQSGVAIRGVSGQGTYTKYSRIYMEGGEIRNFVTASTTGGAIHLGADAQMSMSGGKITGNKANMGGAVYLNAASAKFAVSGNATISNNAATTNGGAVYISSGDMPVTGGTFSGNSASAGGGAIFLKAAVAKLTVTGTEAAPVAFNNNSAASGGAILRDYGNTTITYANFDGNKATAKGGALYVGNSGTLTLSNVTIENTVSHDGAIHLRNKKSTLNINGNTNIINNTNFSGKPANVYLNYFAAGGSEWGDVNLSAMAPTAKIGVTICTTVDNKGTDVVYSEALAPVVQVAECTDGTYKAGMVTLDNTFEGKVGIQNDLNGNIDAKNAIFIAGSAGNGQIYDSAQEALENAGTGGTASDVVTLNKDLSGTEEEKVSVTLPATTGEQAVQIDLKGNSIGANVELNSNGTTKLYVADSSLGYDSNDTAVIPAGAVGDNVTIPSAYKVGNKRYVAIEQDDGSYKIHRVQLAVSARALRPSEMSVGVKVRFSKAMSMDDFTFGMHFDIKDENDNPVKEVPVALNTQLVNGRDLTVILTDFGLANNPEHAEYTVIGTPYIVLKGTEEKLYGSPVELSFKAMVQYADKNYENLNEAQQEAIDAMCETPAFKGTNYLMWNLKNIAQQ